MSNKFWGPDKPIKTQKEWERVFEKQAAIVAKTLDIPLEDARKRQKALLESGIMEKGHPGDRATQKKIDMFLQGIGRPIKYFSVYTETNPDGPGLLYGIQAIRDSGFSFILKYEGGKMWLKDKEESERVVKMFDQRNQENPAEMAQFH